MSLPETPAAPAAAAARNRALAALFLAFALTHGVYRAGRALFHYKQGVDFTPEYVAARMLADHGDRRFYDLPVLEARGRELGLHGAEATDPVMNYAYPPWLPVAYVPISRLPWNAARKLWFLLGLAATLAGAALAAAAVAPVRAERRAYALGGIAAACFYFPLFYGLMDGQANDLPLLGVAACLFLLRENRPLAAGLALAPAAMWKIFPGFPAIFLLVRREWRALGGLALGCAAIVLVSLPFVGIETWKDWIVYIKHHNELDHVQIRNHGILSNAMLLFQPNAVGDPIANAPALVRPVTIALELLAAALAACTLVRPAPRESARYALGFGATLVFACLSTPKSWEHYGIYLLPAFAALFAAAGTARRSPHLVALAVAGGAFAVWGLVFQVKDEYAALAHGWRVLLIPAKMYASFAILAASAWLALRDEAPAPAEAAA
ncbi:MAG TPA: glycosyltransferase family 87 protein [Planctomycetota bacterium]|nr:glycosyltransferase family 87 protein [Planctomycetota bacterium]